MRPSNSGRPPQPSASGGRGEGLDESEIEGQFPREDKPSAVAHSCDGRARQHPQGRHRDDLHPHPAHQDQVRVPDDLHIIKLHAPRAIDHDPALGLARRVGRAPGAPLGVTHVGAVRGRSRECGNATPLLIRSANRGRKRWSTRAATAQHAGRSPRQAAGEERAAPRLPGGCRGAWARRALGVTRSVTRSGTTPTKRSQPVEAGRLASCSARTSADSPHGAWGPGRTENHGVGGSTPPLAT